MVLPQMDLLRSQIMTVMAMKESTTIYQIIFSMFAMIFLDEFVKLFSKMMEYSKASIQKYIHHKTNNVVNKISKSDILSKQVKTASILLEKDYKNKSPNDFVDAVLEHITKLPTIKYMRYQNTFFIHHREEFEIAQNIYARCVDEQVNAEGGAIEYLKIEIYSYHHNITYLREYLLTINRDFMISKKNQLGDQRYYFENLFVSAKKNSGYMTTVFEKQFQFTMTPFHTNKNLTNIYGNYMERVVKRVNFFIHNKDWYQRKGIPHTLGLLLHGEPGCGKTSLIKAIAKATNRHIFSISLNDEITQTQMKNLFYSEEVMMVNKKDGKMETLIIPIDQRIYVMEDVDCMSEILYQRAESRDSSYILDELCESSESGESNIGEINNILSNYQPLNAGVEDEIPSLAREQHLQMAEQITPPTIEENTNLKNIISNLQPQAYNTQQVNGTKLKSEQYIKHQLENQNSSLEQEYKLIKNKIKHENPEINIPELTFEQFCNLSYIKKYEMINEIQKIIPSTPNYSFRQLYDRFVKMRDLDFGRIERPMSRNMQNTQNTQNIHNIEMTIKKKPQISQQLPQQKTQKTSSNQQDTLLYPEEDEMQKMESKEKLTLSFILNLLDGILETPGRILILTSNYPDKLDRALIRPGRIDLNIKFTKANKSMIIEMFNHFYDALFQSQNEEYFTYIRQIEERVKDNQYTPAEINRLLFENFENPENFVQAVTVPKGNL